MYSGKVWCVAGVGYGHKKRVSLIYRTATTAYPCCLPALGEFCRSWSYMTYPGTKVRKFINIPNENEVSLFLRSIPLFIMCLNIVVCCYLS